MTATFGNNEGSLFPHGAGRVAFGGLLVVLGIVLLLDRAGLLVGTWRTTTWPVLLMAYGAARLLIATRHGREGLFFVLAGAWWLAASQGWVSWVNTWPLLFVALGASVVLQALTTPRRGSPEDEALRGRHDGAASWVLVAILIGAWVTSDYPRWTNASLLPDGRPRLITVASRGHAASEGRPFGGAQLISVMGRGELDLTQAPGLTGPEVVVDVMTLMGSTTVRVPEGWIVDTRPVTVFGAVRKRREWDTPATDAAGAPSAAPDRPRVVLRGAVIMGSLTIAS